MHHIFFDDHIDPVSEGATQKKRGKAKGGQKDKKKEKMRGRRKRGEEGSNENKREKENFFKKNRLIKESYCQNE